MPGVQQTAKRETSIVSHHSLREKWLHRLYQIGVALKGIDGILETAGGLLFLLMSRSAITHLVFSLTRSELLEDPDDWIANTLRHTFAHLSSGAKLFGGAYLLAHGIIKIGLVISLWRNKLWAFPTAAVLLGMFICYQVYRLTTHYSLGLVALTCLDAFIILLIWHEYRMVKKRSKN